MSRDRLIAHLARRTATEAVISVFLAGLILMGFLARPWLTASLLAGILLGVVVLLARLQLPERSSLVRAGYWFLEARPIASLHFLPPRDLRTRQRTMTSVKALTSLRRLLRDLEGHGVQFLYIETAIPLVGRLGFQRLWPAAPLSAVAAVLQEVVTGTLRFRWPWVWVFMPRPR